MGKQSKDTEQLCTSVPVSSFQLPGEATAVETVTSSSQLPDPKSQLQDMACVLKLTTLMVALGSPPL